MNGSSHSLFVIFLVLIGSLAVISLSARGCSYYLTPLDQRAFRPDYRDMRPSGPYSHSLGIIGSLMVIVGVSTYSSRKRLRSMWQLGRLSRWLEFHIFLCLLGPVLIVYHTTFKAGGIASITLWTMLSVVASGVVGRFLYTQIPRNRNGTELSIDEIGNTMQQLGELLASSGAGAGVIRLIDNAYANIEIPKGPVGVIRTLIRLEEIKLKTHQAVNRMIDAMRLPVDIAKKMREAASARTSLLQKSLLFTQVERLFFYWHAIHLPFTVIMFLTLAAHVTVALLLGYRWIF
jgi:hypothetical protein